MSRYLEEAPRPTAGQLAAIEKLKASIESCEKEAERREERIRNCEVEATDCCLSIAANDANQSLARRKIQILECGGYALMTVVRNRETGEIVAERASHGEYGSYWRIDGVCYGAFASCPKRTKLWKAGYEEVERWLPAWADFGKGGWLGHFPIENFPIENPKYLETS